MKCETLDVWDKSVQLSSEVYKFFREFKNFGFKDQITRSALSIPSNVAEGMEKESYKEQIRFLEIAKGSAAEFETQVFIGLKVHYINSENASQWIEISEHILSMLTRLKKSILNRNT